MAAVAAIIARRRAKEKENQGYMLQSPGIPDGRSIIITITNFTT